LSKLGRDKALFGRFVSRLKIIIVERNQAPLPFGGRAD
jgi:hypothetical protein